MSTTIDSLDIQIRSSAGSAAVNIDRLADSLIKLKQSGKISTVANNLKKLSESLNGLKNTNQGIQALERFGNTFKRVSQFTGDSSGFSKAINTLKKLPALAGELKTLDLSGFSAQMQALESGMSSLSGIANPKGLTSSLNALKKIPEITNSLDTKTLDEFGDKIEKLATKLGPLAIQIEKVGNGFAKLPSQVSKTVTATNRMEQATHKATEANKKHDKSLNTKSINLMATIQNLQEYAQAIHFVADGIGNVLNDAMQWDGIQFRFGRAFGEDAEEVLTYSEKISEKLGINQQQFMQYSSMYGSLLSGFGMAQEQVTTISVGLAELSYDIWAAYNDRYQSLEDASEAVRSAITGEIEPIRNAGIALTEASMQEYLDSLGMASVKMANLSEAQKSEVRYATMVNAAMNQGIVGTYAAEMNTAEGVMRNLAMQTKTLAQAFGSLLIPVLLKVIPWVTAFVNVLTSAAHAIAAFFGIEMQKISWGDSINSAAGGIQKVADGAGDATGALKDAGKEAKKLKDYTMGFDELNIINPPDDKDKSGSGGGAGAGGVGTGGSLGLDLDTLWDDSVFANAKKQAEELEGKVKEILKWVALIGAGFAAWKIGKGVSAFFKLKPVVWLTDFTKALFGAAKGSAAAKSAIAFMLEPITKLGTALSSGIFSKGLGAAIMGAGGGGLAASVGAIAAFAAGIGLLAVGLYDVFKNSELFRSGLEAIGDFLSWIGNGFERLGTKIANLFPNVDLSIGGINQKLQELTGGFIGLSDIAIAIGGLVLFGPWGLAIEGVILAIKGIGWAFGDDVIPQVNLFGKGISDVTKEKVEPFLTSMNELDRTISELDWGNAKITIADMEDVKAQLSDIVNTITSELDSDRNEALSKLEPLAAAFGEERYGELVKSVNKSYDTMKTSVLEGETRINEIMAKASKENRALTDDEAKEINRIRKEMTETGVKYLSESETESNLILQRMKDNATKLSAEQASEVIASAREARDETIKAAEEQYKDILLEAQRMLDTGTINKEQYDEIVKAAEKTKTDTTKAANDQYSEIVKTARSKMGEYAKYIDAETGELKSRWNVWCDDLKVAWSDAMGSLKKKASEKWGELTTWFNESVAPKFTKKYWEEKFGVIKEGFSSAWKKLKEWWENLELPSFKIKTPHISWSSTPAKGWIATTLEALGLPSSIPKMNIEWYANGGFPDMGQMFIAREAGPELVGNINGRTAVANNDQIVAAVSQGVYSAVMAAMGNNNNSGEQNVNVYLDGKQIYASVEKTKAERGRTLMGNQLGYGY